MSTKFHRNRRMLAIRIRVTKDVPGVGSNLQDHLTAGANNVILKEESAGLALTLPQMISPSAIWQYLISSSGPVSSNGCEAYALVYTSDKINRTLEPPDTQFLFFPTGHTFEGGTVIKKMSGVSDEVWEHTFAPLTGTPVASIFAVLLRPKSRGTIRLQSADPEHHPLIDPKYLTHPDDVTTFVRGLKKVVELIESQPFKSRGAMLNKIPLQGCEHFEFGSDQYWSCYIRYLSGTVYHPCGTCKMGPATDQFAVVDEELRVRGVHGLRVIDASIFPNIIGANTYAATVMVGEKGAHMIRQLWARRASSCQWTDFFIPQRKSPSDIAW